MDIRSFKAKHLASLIGRSDSPELDLDIIIALCLDKDRTFLYSHPEYEIPIAAACRAGRLIKKRQHGYPVAYLRGYQPFMGLEFQLNRQTLVPRPETEIMVEKILEEMKENTLVIDVGTGSGAIAVSLAKLNKKNNCRFAATDISLQALSQARRNAKRQQAAIDFYWRDLIRLFPWKKYADYKNLIIAANLPYLSPEIYKEAKTIRKEPKWALLSQEKGLHHYRRLFQQLEKVPHRFAHILAYCEISPEQTPIFREYYKEKDKEMWVTKDLTGKDRIIKVVWQA